MLKFSGFAYLTSCHGKKPQMKWQTGGQVDVQQTKQQVTHKAQGVYQVADRARNPWIQCIRGRKSTLMHRHTLLSVAWAKHMTRWQWHERILTLKQACFQGYPESAVYVQIPIGSRNSAIHNAYHTSLRPSSLFEPRHPSLKVVCESNMWSPTS